MKRNSSSLWPMLRPALIALALMGCQPKPGESARNGQSVEIGPKYSPKNGLHVPDDTRRSIGLKLVDVTERKIPATLGVQLRVYQKGEKLILTSAAVSLEEAQRLKSGQSVLAHANSWALSGRVLRVEERWHKATGMAELLVELARTSDTVSVGDFLSASVSIDSLTTVVSIPRAALLECSDGPVVYTVNGESFVRTPVKVGARAGDVVEIREGLYAGDQVVLQPVMALWMIELAAVKGGQACCVVPKKGK